MSKAKSVIDAVIEFNGDLPSTGKMVNQRSGLWRVSAYHTYYSVCTTDEFNTEVESMSHHAGVKLYERYVRAVKVPLTKETKVECLIGQEMSLNGWSEIKGSYGDGITYRCVSGDSPNDPDAVFITGREYTANGTGVVDEYDKGSKTSICITGSSILKLIRIPKPSPVFTKAMSDAGELPQVGSSVLYNVCHRKAVTELHIKHDQSEMDVVAIDNQLIVLLSKDKSFATACNNYWIKPIDTRTDKEKADDKMRESLEDGKAYQFESHDETRNGVYGMGSFINNEGDFAITSCTNIQPLTVADK